MSEYNVKSNLGGTEWQINNQARQHSFVCDDIHKDGSDAGPNPVEYLTAAVNSCITMSAGMVIKSRQLPIKNFHLTSTATTTDLGHSRSIVESMTIEVGMSTDLTDEERQAFLNHVLDVSTVYQTVKKAVDITVKLI